MGLTLRDFFNRAKLFFHRSKNEVIKTTVIGKTMIEESQLETRKRNLIRELGELTFDLYGKGEIKNRQVESFCRKINMLLSKIDEKESTIDDIKSGKHNITDPGSGAKGFDGD